MTDSEVLTHGGTDRRGRLCRCARCHVECRCTPAFDFFTLHGDPFGPLYCQWCLLLTVGRSGLDSNNSGVWGSHNNPKAAL